MLPENYIRVKKARLIFPHLYSKVYFNGEKYVVAHSEEEKAKGKYKATFIIDKNDTETLKAIKTIMTKLEVENKVKFKTKTCVEDGDDAEETYKHGHICISASSGNRFPIVNRDKTPIGEDDNIIYAGCYVDVVLSFYESHGRFNCGINGIMFNSNGEPLGSRLDADELFEGLGDSDNNTEDSAKEFLG